MAARYDAVLFDLLTALVDSWTLWNRVAGDEERGRRWRGTYLELTYGADRYRAYEEIVAEAALREGLGQWETDTLIAEWNTLQAWPEVPAVLDRLAGHVKLGIVTNCSRDLGHRAARALRPDFDVVVTSDEAGFYKPRPEPYLLALRELGTTPERTLFVAGSRFDIPGAGGVGMPVWWHNRVGMSRGDLPRPAAEYDSLATLPEFVLRS